MKIRLTVEEYEEMRAVPLPWWDRHARWTLSKVSLETPAVEHDGSDQPTGYVVMHHPDIDEWDVFTFEVFRAGLAFIRNRPDADDLRNLQRSNDWAAWASLEASVDAGVVSADAAVEQARAYMLRLGATLGVAPPEGLQA